MKSSLLKKKAGAFVLQGVKHTYVFRSYIFVFNIFRKLTSGTRTQTTPEMLVY